MSKQPQIELRTTPHVHAPQNVVVIMRNVVLALVPATACAVWVFGLSSLLLILVVLAATLGTERLFSERNTLGDWSATITALLLALSLPPAFPLWMGAVAGFVAIALGKALFGGLGMNLFNPALVGRAFVQAAFPAAITTWTAPMLVDRFIHVQPSTLTLPFLLPAENPAVDGFSGATPLGMHKFSHLDTPIGDLFFGQVAGSAGETSALLILIGGLYLASRRMLDWRIPASVLGSAWLLTAILRWYNPEAVPSPEFMLMSGGLMLGAWFMATDMVGSPLTPLGVMVYGSLIGVLTVLIRLYGGLSEGVMYAILFANAATPIIDQLTQPRVFGQSRSKP